jgi:hypothetical protein
LPSGSDDQLNIAAAQYYTEDIAATDYHCLGIPLETTHQTPDGRPVQVNYDGRVIRELV